MSLLQNTVHLVTIIVISAAVFYASADNPSGSTRNCPKQKQMQCSVKTRCHDSIKSCKKDAATSKPLQRTSPENQASCVGSTQFSVNVAKAGKHFSAFTRHITPLVYPVGSESQRYNQCTT
ncbi:MAG: hypothetical protein GX640_01320 [Fibrobacter sp.]|nr:hypothetical protein [Fibrobacter sp.]